MVRKRVKRKATATSSSSASGVENIEKSSPQGFSEDLGNVTAVTPDKGMSHNDLDIFLKGHAQPLSDNPASEKVTMVFGSALKL